MDADEFPQICASRPVASDLRPWSSQDDLVVMVTKNALIGGLNCPIGKFMNCMLTSYQRINKL